MPKTSSIKSFATKTAKKKKFTSKLCLFSCLSFFFLFFLFVSSVFNRIFATSIFRITTHSTRHSFVQWAILSLGRSVGITVAQLAGRWSQLSHAFKRYVWGPDNLAANPNHELVKRLPFKDPEPIPYTESQSQAYSNGQLGLMHRYEDQSELTPAAIQDGNNTGFLSTRPCTEFIPQIEARYPNIWGLTKHERIQPQEPGDATSVQQQGGSDDSEGGNQLHGNIFFFTFIFFFHLGYFCD